MNEEIVELIKKVYKLDYENVLIKYKEIIDSYQEFDIIPDDSIILSSLKFQCEYFGIETDKKLNPASKKIVVPGKIELGVLFVEIVIQEDMVYNPDFRQFVMLSLYKHENCSNNIINENIISKFNYEQAKKDIIISTDSDRSKTIILPSDDYKIY